MCDLDALLAVLDPDVVLRCDDPVIRIALGLGKRSGLAHARWFSRCKHLLEGVEQVVHGRRRKSPEMANQPLSIHGPKLIDNNLAVLAGEAAWHAKRVPVRGRGHGR